MEPDFMSKASSTMYLWVPEYPAQTSKGYYTRDQLFFRVDLHATCACHTSVWYPQLREHQTYMNPGDKLRVRTRSVVESAFVNLRTTQILTY